MSRVERHQKKALKKRAYLLGGLLIVVIIFISNIGLGLLANTSLFVGRLFSGNEAQEESALLDTLELDELDPATSSAQIKVSGFAHGYDKLEYYINGDKVEQESISTDESFEKEIGSLREGENKIYVMASSKKRSGKKKSNTVTVSYLAKKPEIELSEPSDGAKVNKDEVKVAGRVTGDVTVRVNGFPAVLNSEGKFETIAKLKEGDNKIKIEAEDLAGNIGEKEITVKYEKE